MEHLTSAQVGLRWACHRTTVLKICKRFGYSGIKFGGRSSCRRFAIAKIERIESLAANTQPTKK